VANPRRLPRTPAPPKIPEVAWINRPTKTRSTIFRRNSGGYGGRDIGTCELLAGHTKLSTRAGRHQSTRPGRLQERDQSPGDRTFGVSVLGEVVSRCSRRRNDQLEISGDQVAARPAASRPVCRNCVVRNRLGMNRSHLTTQCVRRRSVFQEATGFVSGAALCNERPGARCNRDA
jgi:hypothetical protein